MKGEDENDMRFISIRRIGAILVFVGIILIGFFGIGFEFTGSITFPLAEEIQSWFSGIGMEYTVNWWNSKLVGVTIGLVGTLLLKFG